MTKTKTRNRDLFIFLGNIGVFLLVANSGAIAATDCSNARLGQVTFAIKDDEGAAAAHKTAMSEAFACFRRENTDVIVKLDQALRQAKNTDSGRRCDFGSEIDRVTVFSWQSSTKVSSSPYDVVGHATYVVSQPIVCVDDAASSSRFINTASVHISERKFIVGYEGGVNVISYELTLEPNADESGTWRAVSRSWTLAERLSQPNVDAAVSPAGLRQYWEPRPGYRPYAR